MVYLTHEKQGIKQILEEDLLIRKKTISSLEECLNGYTKEKLLRIRDDHDLTGVNSRHLKKDIVNAVADKIQDTFASKVTYLSAEQYAALSQVPGTPLSFEEFLGYDYLIPLIVHGWLYLVAHEKGYVLIFPNELAAILEKESASETFQKALHLHQTQLSVLRSLTNLYGVFDPDFFLNVWDTYYPQHSMSADELISLLQRSHPLSFSIESNGKWIYHKQVLSSEAAEQVALQAKQHPLYWPTKADITYYGAHFYDIRTPEYHALKDVLQKIVPKEALPIVEERFFTHAKLASPLREFTHIFNELNIAMTDKQQIHQFTSVYSQAFHTSRMWVNAGHTPNELSTKQRPALQTVARSQVASTNKTPKKSRHKKVVRKKR